MIARLVWGAGLLTLLAAPPAPAAEAEARACRGTLQGAVEGTFRCAVEARSAGDSVGLTVTALEPAGEALALSPGGFQLAAPLAARRLALDDLEAARVSVTAKDGALYSATKGTRSRGELTLVLTEVKGPVAGRYQVHGSLRAVLLPSGSPKPDRVTLDVEF